MMPVMAHERATLARQTADRNARPHPVDPAPGRSHSAKASRLRAVGRRYRFR